MNGTRCAALIRPLSRPPTIVASCGVVGEVGAMGPLWITLALFDRTMTPPKAAQGLVTQATNAQVVTLHAGHSLMTEAPDGVLRALQTFLKA